MKVKGISDFQACCVDGRWWEDGYKTWYVAKLFFGCCRIWAGWQVGGWKKKVNDVFGFWKTVMGGEKHEVQSWRSRVGQVGSGKGRMDGGSVRMGRVVGKRRRSLTTAGVTKIFRFFVKGRLTVEVVSGEPFGRRVKELVCRESGLNR